MHLDLFNRNDYFKEVEDLIGPRFLINSIEIKNIFEIFNKKFSNEINLFLEEGTNEENFSLFERNIFFRKIESSNDRTFIKLVIIGEIVIDIEKFFNQVQCLLETRLINFQKNNHVESYLNNTDIGLWALDAIGNILYKNDLAHIILESSEYSNKGFEPRISFINNNYYLIISEPNFDKNIFLFYAFIISESELKEVTSQLIKELSLETSILAHELKNPLTGIKFASELLNMDSDFKETATEINKSVARCYEIIEVFLNFYKKDYSNSSNKVDFESIMKKVKSMLGPRCQSMKLRFLQYIEIRGAKNKSLLTLSFYILMNDLVSNINRSQLVGNLENKCSVLQFDRIDKKNILRIRSTDLNCFINQVRENPSLLAFYKILMRLNNMSFNIYNNELHLGES